MRRTTSCLIALAVGALVAVVPASGTVAQSGSAAAVDARPVPKSVVRAYGDGPVRHARGQRVRIRFRGSPGDKVMLTRDGTLFAERQARLADPDGHRLRRERPWYRLRDRGWHTFDYRPTPGTRRGTLQLTKVRTLDAERDAGPRRLRERRGRVFAVGFTVPAHGLLSGGVTGADERLLVKPGTKAARVHHTEALVLGDGLPLVTSHTPGGKARVAGATFRMLVRGGSAAAWTPTRVAGSIGGPMVPVDDSDPTRATEVVFEAAAGQWVDLVPSDADWWVSLLRDPVDGGLVWPSAVRDLWHVPSGGTQSLLLVPVGDGAAPGGVTLTGIPQQAPLVIGAASATTYTADAPGRSFMVPVVGDGYYRKIVTSNQQLGTDWRISLMKDHVGVPPRGCNGCGEDDRLDATPENPTTQGGAGRWVYVRVPDGVLGRVDLQAVASGYLGRGVVTHR